MPPNPNQSADFLVEETQEEKELFEHIKSVMQKEVDELPNVATRRAFLQKIATYSTMVPATILLMSTDSKRAEACWECTTDGCCIAPCVECITDCCVAGICVECITDFCLPIWDYDICNGCLGCVNQGRAGCRDGRNDGN